MRTTAVVAYSGGLDTSCIVAWLKEEPYGFDEVVAVLVDVGQAFDLEESITRANAAGAEDVLVIDRKDAFAEEQCARAIVTNALYEGKYPLVSALSRPVIAQAVAEIALELGAEAVVHGCTGKGNDQLRFELAFKAHYPGVRVHRAAPRPDLDARRGDRVRARAGYPGRSDGRVPVLDRRESLRARHRGGDPRGSLERVLRTSRTRSPPILRPHLLPSRSWSASSAGSPGLARRGDASAGGADRAR